MKWKKMLIKKSLLKSTINAILFSTWSNGKVMKSKLNCLSTCLSFVIKERTSSKNINIISESKIFKTINIRHRLKFVYSMIVILSKNKDLLIHCVNITCK